jgi:hypothetical protein
MKPIPLDFTGKSIEGRRTLRRAHRAHSYVICTLFVIIIIIIIIIVIPTNAYRDIPRMLVDHSPPA